MNTFISVMAAILIFCVIILIHEFGHFFVARLFKIKVSEFSIGMGPAIYKKEGKNTTFCVRALPIGGACVMGEDLDDDDPDSFRKKPVYAKIAVVAAGAIMNIVLGFIIAVIALFVDGTAVSTKIVYFDEEAVSPSYGLQLEDEIVKINGVRIFTSKDILYQLRQSEDGIVDMVVKRNGKLTEVNDIHFPVDKDEESGENILRYDFKVLGEKVTIMNVVPYAFKNCLYFGRIVFMSFGDLVSGKYGINDLQGPVGIVSVIGGTATEAGVDWDLLLQMATLITINVGIFNLIPLPALDGGRLVFLVIEIFRRKPMKAEIEGMVHFVGFALLMLLMIVVTFNDVKNIFIK